MKTLIICLFLLVPMHVFAGACGDYEYAELQDMDQQTLEQEYCKAVRIYIGFMKTRNFLSPIVQKDCNSCDEMISRMQRIYAKKMGLSKEETILKLKEVCGY